MCENPIAYIIQSISDIERVINANVLLREKRVKFEEAALSSILLLCKLSCWLRFATNYSNTFQLKD
jgi:hypothetical protein